jgi:hypothetical protein
VALEHEARGLLNLIVIASRCLEGSADAGEREAWHREIHAAREQLEGLCGAGLSRTFLKEPRAGPCGAVNMQPVTLPTDESTGRAG